MILHLEAPETSVLLAVAVPVAIYACCEIACALVGIGRDLIRIALDLPLEPRQ